MASDLGLSGVSPDELAPLLNQLRWEQLVTVLRAPPVSASWDALPEHGRQEWRAAAERLIELTGRGQSGT